MTSFPASRSSSVRLSPRGSQGGIALVVALILLVVMTLVGLSGLRNVTLEERMTANTFDRSVSFQAAEAALKEAEVLVQTQNLTMRPGAGICIAATGVCGPPVPLTQERWIDNTAPWVNATALANGGINITPQYMIEFLELFPCPGGPAGTDCPRYRITSRSNAGADRSDVLLQSIYVP